MLVSKGRLEVSYPTMKVNVDKPAEHQRLTVRYLQITVLEHERETVEYETRIAGSPSKGRDRRRRE
jgi:hypothetical protein